MFVFFLRYSIPARWVILRNSFLLIAMKCHLFIDVCNSCNRLFFLHVYQIVFFLFSWYSLITYTYNVQCIYTDTYIHVCDIFESEPQPGFSFFLFSHYTYEQGFCTWQFKNCVATNISYIENNNNNHTQTKLTNHLLPYIIVKYCLVIFIEFIDVRIWSLIFFFFYID